MKQLILSIGVLATINVQAQKNQFADTSSESIEMLFPNGKSKALILSFDDGRSEDRQLVELMNRYQLKGTFHLNSNKLNTNEYLTKSEIKTLFKGHEVSVHTANHPGLSDLSKSDIVREVLDDRKELERLVGYPVRGMAYPFGNYNEKVVDVVKDLGIEYSRTVEDTYGFELPSNFLKWHPTIHQFAKAFWEPNNTANDEKELARFYQVIQDFLAAKEVAVLDVWGHSWEMSNSKLKWDETEKYFKMLANNPDIFYARQIDLVHYIHAFRNLIFSADQNLVLNQSALTVYFKKNQKTYTLKPGKMVSL